jgi:hypothetical protein
MKAKIICILVMVLLISTALPAFGIMNDKQENPVSLGICGNAFNNQLEEDTIKPYNRGNLFIQLPLDRQWSATSDTSSGYLIYDDFWEISGEICDIHWWGQCLKLTDEWYMYDPTGMTFKIEFYSDDNSKPGDLLCSYEDIIPTPISTGIWYYYSPRDVYFPVYYYEVTLEPCCQISTGWVSIQSTYVPSGGWFQWVGSRHGNELIFQYHNGVWNSYPYDMSFILTDGTENQIPDLECEGSLSWTGVKPREKVTGDFTIRNNGEPDSVLQWKIESYPTDWGEWMFTPNASALTIDDGWKTVHVQVVAPDVPNTEFTGKIKLVNLMEPSDSCIIEVYLKTPRTKTINNPFLNWLKSHPNMFPILRQLLGL